MPLDDRSSHLREHVLIPSGGWLGEGTILLSDMLGLWDIFILMAFFVVFWVIMRTAGCEISLVLGLVFDLGIPLQYQNDPAQKVLHERHLSRYWPVFILGSGIELAGFFFFHPDLFTLVVCLKTTGCLAMWLMKTADGQRVQLSSAVGAAAARQSTNSRPSRAPLAPSASTYQVIDPRFPDAASRLQKAGHDPLAIEGMIGLIKGNKDDDAAKNLNKWAKMRPTDPVKWQQHQAKYKARALKDRAASGVGNNGQGGSSGSRPSGPAIVLDNEQIDQIMNKLSRKLSEEQAREIVRGLLNISDARQLQTELANIGMLVESAAKLNLTDKMEISAQQGRYHRLTRPMSEKGLEISNNTADLMMLDMLQQRTIEEADALYNAWRAIGEMPNSREKRARRDEVVNRYKDHVNLYKGRDYNAQRLIMPWDPPDRRGHW